MAKTKGSIFLPLRGKVCSTEEMPFISEKFENFDAFAKASLNEIFDNGQLNNALHREIKNFASIYLENVDGKSFKASRLNNYCQMGPMKDIITFDYNKDGNLDFIYGGKHFPVEVETVFVPKHNKHPLLKSISVSEQALQLLELLSQPLH